jgi:NCS1 family nucleobase:cation symporter-1
MNEAKEPNQGMTNDDQPRRSTYSPPEVEQDVPLNLGEDVPEAPRVAPHPMPTPIIQGPEIPPPPVRTSLSDAEILAQMGHGADTKALIAALQEQMSLRKLENADFDTWETLVRQSVDEETAEAAIAQARVEFGGLATAPAPIVEVEEEPEPVREEIPTEAVAVAEEEPPALVTPEEPQPLDSEEIILPRFGQEPAPVAPEPTQSYAPEVPVAETAVEGEGDFERVLADASAVSPPTDAWPLVATEATPAPVASEPTPVVQPQSVPIVTPDMQGSIAPVKRFGFDHVGEEIAPDNARVDKALQLFWSWWAIGSPVVALLLGAWLVDTGLSLGQAITASVLGVGLASIPVVFGTIVGIRTGLPALMASRAAFGLAGNVIPAIAMTVVRILVSAGFIWAATWMMSGILLESNYWNGEPAIINVIMGAVSVVIAVALAVVGRGIVQLTLWASATLATLGLIGLVLVTAGPVSSAAFGRPSADVATIVAGVAMVMSVFMVVWAQSGSDLARFHVRYGTAAASSVSAVGAVVPPLILLSWGALLGASSDEFRSALFVDFFDTVLELAPDWYVIPAILFLGLPLIGLASLGLHSSGYALMSLGAKMPRFVAVSIASAVAAVSALGVVVFVPGITAYLSEILLVSGVVVASFVGAVAGETLTRRVHLDATLLTGQAGSYYRWRIAPVIGFVLAVDTGFGLVESSHGWPWLGFHVDYLALAGIDVSGWNMGPIVALLIALAFNAFAGIKTGVSLGKPKVAASE